MWHQVANYCFPTIWRNVAFVESDSRKPLVLSNDTKHPSPNRQKVVNGESFNIHFFVSGDKTYLLYLIGLFPLFTLIYFPHVCCSELPVMFLYSLIMMHFLCFISNFQFFTSIKNIIIFAYFHGKNTNLKFSVA